MRETANLEFKKTPSESFLKTVTAFANYGEGTILFGVDDDGTEIGLDDPLAAALTIENKINDCIEPRPSFSLKVNEGSRTVALTVRQGRSTPYFYRLKTYKRSDSSTVEVDSVELTRLILAGQNRSFDALRAARQDCEFSVLEERLKSVAGIEHLTRDTLKTLQLFSDAEGYTNAGALLADANDFPGVDAVRFGENANQLLDRRTFDCRSVLTQLDQAIEMYRTYYCYEEIEGTRRVPVQLVPEEAFREAIANALVHRTWDVGAHIRLSMFPDRIEVASPGGLTAGVSEREYLEGQVSLLRNPILGDVFFRLGIIERFGTGVLRIKAAYAQSCIRPRFEVFENSLLVVLPVASPEADLTEDETRVYEQLRQRGALSSSQLVSATGFGKTKVLRLVNGLVERGYVKKRGTARDVRYYL